MDKIIIRGAKQHNLKNISLEIPKNSLVVVTGLSGSGKSTLAFDTIYAEGHRRYVESLSAYARQFLDMMDKPDIDSIDGLSPAISIQQKTTNKNPRSTVGTVTEIYDYLRLLYSRVGIPYCPNCNNRISPQPIDSIVSFILSEAKTNISSSLLILSPVIRSKKGTFEKLLGDIKSEGFTKIRYDGNLVRLDDFHSIFNHENRLFDRQKKHSVEIVVDRFECKDILEDKSRLFDSIQSALKTGNGVVIASFDGVDRLFSQNNACIECQISIDELEPRSFSFNSPFGACEGCNGLGFKIEFDPDLVIPDKSKSIIQGAIKPWNGYFANFRSSMLRDVGKKFGFDLNTPIDKMSKDQLDVILFGTNTNIKYKYQTRAGNRWEYQSSFEGVIPNLERVYKETESDSKREELRQFIREKICDTCNGKRLKKLSLSVKILNKSIIDVCNLSILQCYRFITDLSLSDSELFIAKNILKEIISRLEFLIDVGLDYLSLNRSVATLSGGESQRIRLATQIGSNLTGVLYVLDEPTIGLHQRDNDKLIKTLKRLRDLGNTLIVVEHDRDIMLNADWLIDIGPGAGIHGGNIVAQGTLTEILQSYDSLTASFLRESEQVVSTNSNPPEKWLKVIGANENNLKCIDVEFPISLLTVVTGVSGSGKSTLVNEVLYHALNKHFNKSSVIPGKHQSITGLENIDKVICIDQSPIGRTPRSNPITYVNAFGYIRELFAKTLGARERGFKPGRFSFNVPDGRCEACEGGGVKKIEMQFLPDVHVTCNICSGKRYNSETLAVKYKGKSIYEILEMTVDEAFEFFSNISSISKKLQTLKDVGLGYLKLGQPATTLSGGEAQRIKLASELSKKSTGKTLYILDEPTTGLHFADVKRLLDILKRFVSLGNTVIVIEHNLDVIVNADWIIDLGPEGGDNGGQIIAVGHPSAIASNNLSYTGRYIKQYCISKKIA